MQINSTFLELNSDTPVVKTREGYNIQNSTLILPDGTMKKLTDVSKLHSLGWKHKVDLVDGIKQMYRWYTHGN